MQRKDFKLVADYFLLEWAALSDKTRSVVLSMFTSMADVLNRGLLGMLFSGETNVSPLDVEAGKIIVIDLPVKEFGDVGLFANLLWKTSFMRSIERRDAEVNDHGLPAVAVFAVAADGEARTGAEHLPTRFNDGQVV